MGNHKRGEEKDTGLPGTRFSYTKEERSPADREGGGISHCRENPLGNRMGKRGGDVFDRTAHSGNKDKRSS